MRILYCLDSTYNSAGKERIVVGKANWLAEHGHKVAIFTTEQDGRPDFFPLKNVERFDSDILFSRLKDSKPVSKFFGLIKKRKKALGILKEYVEYFNPDIIISTHGHELKFVSRLKGPEKKIIETHFTRWFRLQRKRKRIWEYIDKYLTIRDLHDIKKFDKLVCLTREDRENWKELEGIEVINNFIEKKNPSPSPLENKSVLAVGRLEFQKGYDRLIEAWSIVNKFHPDWELNIFGQGSLKEKLLTQINDCHLTSSVLIHEPTENIQQQFRNHSAFVMTSHYEGLPMVMLEAMEAGLPVISFDFQCGPKDFIKNGENGFLVKNGDIKDLAVRICQIIENEELRKKMGTQAFHLAKNNYPELIMQKWLKLFEQLSVNK